MSSNSPSLRRATLGGSHYNLTTFAFTTSRIVRDNRSSLRKLRLDVSLHHCRGGKFQMAN